MQKKILLILTLMIVAALQVAAAGKFVLVIDPGHGGKDSGAPGKTSVEKNINLQVALAFGKYVENNCPDVKVVYTRTTDVFVELKERANIANRNKADLFISIHTNALDGGKISRGFETYTLGMHRAADNLNVAKRENSVILIEKNYKQSYAGFDPNSSESYIMFEILQDKNMANSVDLAKTIQSEVCASSGRVNKGVHQAGFLVLRETSMPSCLVEMGFITTSDEEAYLNTKDGQDKIAKGLYNAFVKYKKKHGKMAENDDKQENVNEDGRFMADNADAADGNFESHYTPISGDGGDLGMGNEAEEETFTSIVEDDPNLYSMMEYAQPRAVRDLTVTVPPDEMAMNTQPPEPIQQQATKDSPPDNVQTQNKVAHPNVSATPETAVAQETPPAPTGTPQTQTTIAKVDKSTNPPAETSSTPSVVEDVKPKDTPPQTTNTPNTPNTTQSTSTVNRPKVNKETVATPPPVNNTVKTQPVKVPEPSVQVAPTASVAKETVRVAEVKTSSPTSSAPKETAQVAGKSQTPTAAAPKETTPVAEKPNTPTASATKETAPVAENPNTPTASATKETTPVVEKPNTPAAAAKKETTTVAEKTNTPTTPATASKETNKSLADMREVTAPPQGMKLEGQPIFKVQIAATSEVKPTNSDFFKGVKNIEAYAENGMVKYTVGATSNFAEVEKLRASLLEKFPGAFIVAFRDGYKVSLQSALAEYRKQQKH